MTTPDPADNGSKSSRDQPEQQPENESQPHPSGVPASDIWTTGADAEQQARRDEVEQWAPADNAELWASATDPLPPQTLPSPFGGGRGLGVEPGDDPNFRTVLNGTPVADPPPAAAQAAGSSPDETPTAPQPSLPTPATPTPALSAPGPPGVGPGAAASVGPTPGGAAPGEPPDWSTPETPATSPPIGGSGHPDPLYPQQPPPSGPTPPYPPPPPPPSGPPPSGPVPPYPPGPPLPPPKRSGRWPLIIGIISVLLVCCCAGIIASLFTWGNDAYDEFRDRTRRTIGLNEPGRDGNLEFRVRTVECGIDRVGDPFISQAAVGQYCLAEVNVRNIGDRPAPFSEGFQKAYGPSGRQYGADSGAVLLVNAEDPVFLTDINPGNQVTGILVYDIPPDARIVKLELHSSDGSRGVLVRTG